MTDPVSLIEQARKPDPNLYADPYTRLTYWETLAEQLADALVAALAERDDLQACLNHEETYADKMLPKLRQRAEAAEAARDAALGRVASHHDDVRRACERAERAYQARDRLAAAITLALSICHRPLGPEGYPDAYAILAEALAAAEADQ